MGKAKRKQHPKPPRKWTSGGIIAIKKGISYMKKGRKIQGFWDCSQCGNKKILGGTRECPSCGKARGEDTRFYMDGMHYVSLDKEKEISDNPDWLCSYCGQLNSDNDENCVSCGALKSDSEKNYFEMKGEQEKLDAEKEELQQEFVDSSNSFISKSKNLIQSLNPKIVLSSILAVLATILVVIGIIHIFSPKEDVLNITGVSWERSISIEEERTVKESDWDVPPGGRVYDTANEIHHYDKVLDHYETVSETKTRQVIVGYENYVSGYRDLGNGYFEEIISSRPIYSTETYVETRQVPVYRDVPVYQTKYYYEIERWFYARSVKSSGNDKDVYWGEVILESKEREDKRSEVYSIIATNKKNEKVTYNLDYSEWSDIETGDVLNVKIYFGGKIEIVKP